ncbi:MAG: methyltransferase [Vicinamibacteraceae bacterium]|nr:methyltransferase [Vicinamibacteraceae bacterium]
MTSTRKPGPGQMTVLAAVGLILPLLLGPSANAGPQTPASPGNLKGQAEAAAQAGDTVRALELARQLIDATEPEHVEALYAAARLQARAGNREQVYLLLDRAIGAGFLDRGRLLEDEAFADYRSEDLFRSFARRAWANGYISLLERDNREQVQKSPQIMKTLAFRPGERVADIGAGTGYFTFQVASAVGPTGQVLALDIAPEMLEYLDLRVKARKATNVVLRRVTRDDPQLEPGSVDTILIVDTIHYVKDRTAYARKLLPALAPGGRVVVIDYVPKPMSERPWGPPPEQQFPREQLDREMGEAGFRVLEAHDFLPEQFFVVYGPR